MLIYADLDNNLEVVTIVDQLDPAAAVPSDPDVNVVMLIDRTEEDFGFGGVEDGDLGSIPNFGGAKLVTLGDGDYTEVQDVGEVDMGDPQTLAWFVNTGVTQLPAERYALYVSDHGGGFSGAMWDDSTPVAEGFPGSSHLTVDEVGEGVAAGLDGTGVDSIDLFGFDACLMSMVEIASTLAPVVDFMVASEEITLTRTVPYDALIRLLQDAPGTTAEEAGTYMVGQPGVLSFPGATLALLDLSRMGALDQAVESLADALVDNLDTVATEVGRQRNQSLEFGLDESGENVGYSAVDLGDFLARLTNVPAEVDTARQAAFRALDGVVVEQATGPAATQATGLSLYFPPTDDLYFPEEYGSIDAGRAWNEFLAAYFGEPVGPDDPDDPDDPTGGPPAFVSPTADVQTEAGGVLVFAELEQGTESSVVDATFFGGRLLPDSSVAHLVMTPAVIGAGDARTIAAGWDFGYLQVTDGEVSLDATTLLTPVVDGLLAVVPLLYQGPEGDQLDAALQFTLDAEGLIVDEPVLVSYPESGGVAMLAPEPGSLVAPLVLVSFPGGRVRVPDPRLAGARRRGRRGQPGLLGSRRDLPRRPLCVRRCRQQHRRHRDGRDPRGAGPRT